MPFVGKFVILCRRMKTGSRRFLLSPLVLLAIALVGCVADEVGGIYLLSEETDELHAVANHTTMAYFNAGDKWTAVPSVDWLAVSPSSGEAGKNAIVITTTMPNHTLQERTGTVVISSGGKSETVSIKQRNEYAFFEQKEYVVDSAGGEVNMGFTSNIEKGKLMISYLRLDWIVMSEAKSGSRGDVWNGKVKPVTILANPTPQERSAPFILGFYDENKRFLGLDTAWVRQKPSSEIVEIQDSVALP